MEMERYEIIIVGGGIAGLTAAAFAAREGRQTLLLEQQSHLGGRASTRHENGIYFNLGAHALYNGYAHESFRELGLKLQGGSPSIRARGLWKGRLHVMPTSFASLLQTPLLTRKGKLEMAFWLSKLGKLDTSCLNGINLSDWIEANLKDPLLRHLFHSIMRTATYSSLPHLHAAGPALKQLQSALKGVFYLDKGWGSLVEELRSVAAAHGAKIRTGWKTTAVRHENGRVIGVVNDHGEAINADNVLLAVTPAAACKLVIGSEHTALETWKKQSRPATAACLDVGLKRLPNPDCTFLYGVDQAVFLTDQSRSGTPRASIMSDNGEHTISLIKYHGDDSDAKKDERELENVFDLAQPGWRSELAARQYLPRMTVTPDIPHINRIDSKPGPVVPEIGGLYAAGDWASHGELLADAAVASARRAVQYMLHKAPYSTH
ncbi:Phytoene dehydrogenase-related protein [Paenibacillaceae bacterium GAS479]|nr:Phytoene dehydrogenase-related protein [Paenibacillaceae bacterium GAS479]